MFAEIITIGDEILIGQIIDTNSAFIAQELNKIGVSVYQISSVQDERLHILEALQEAEARADVIIMTGGLGPTKDDITKHTLCEYFNDTLVENKEVLAHVEAIFKKHLGIPLLEVNKNQALVPSKADVLHNEYGTAPGMWIKREGKVFVSLPGVPFEMKNLINTKVLPRIIQEFKRPYIVHKTIITYGIGESSLADRISSVEDNLPGMVKLAYLPSLGSVRLRLSAKGNDSEQLNALVDLEAEKIRNLLGDLVLGEAGDEPVESVIAQLLTKKGMTLGTAESCTGGKIAEQITSIPGASAYFKGSIVSYATETKIEVLKVSKTIIDEFSVVSAEVAVEMATNLRKILKTDFAIATTGNAGPTKGDSDAEVGTVFIAIVSPNATVVEKYRMGSQRERIVQKSVNKAFEMLQKEILKF
ncbi:competence/damage-inducible protein A [Arenibacter algicola]|jgi:nicotinamide-nucleotide amidase|uniref:CinA-like protein n=1 Tax=Arenibacter algicola TaxID=616991 RepID=A0A221V433_9FLAO|nr:competence/damage-inducible protein A [Arenibacter algicola]ASO08329.1 nicotinamide-nucleotide amidohydrolase PncC [Arenibacter algicola]|tara:strand:- start:20687 stop:21934 length:1248 start_codon:yes stop_codon:yes gene_type:complete